MEKQINKRGKMTERQKLLYTIKSVLIKHKPVNEQSLFEALVDEAILPTYKRGKSYGVMIGKKRIRLKSLDIDYLSYKDMEEIDKERVKAKLKEEKNFKPIKSNYQSALDRLNAIDKKNEHEQENEQDQEAER